MTESNATKTTATVKDLRKGCWDAAIHTRATAVAFRRRYDLLRRQVSVVDTAATIVPAVFGCIVLATSPSAIPLLFGFGTFAALLSGLGSIVASARSWRERMSSSLVSQRENERLTRRYERLAKEPLVRDQLVRAKEELDTADDQQTDVDLQHSVSREEMRMGYREAHWLRGLACAECKKVPKSMKPSDCNTCGSFNLSSLIW